MGIIYSTSDSKFDGSFDPHKYSGLRQYEKHFGNLMYLDFIASNPRSTFAEKRQAESEIDIAKRKMKYWKRIVDQQGDSGSLLNVIENVKKQWKQK